jgi:hypothetical protein
MLAVVVLKRVSLSSCLPVVKGIKGKHEPYFWHWPTLNKFEKIKVIKYKICSFDV